MAAPPITARVAPAGRKLRDGYSTKIAFERDPDVSFWEKDVQPMGVDGHEKIDQTTMHNTDRFTYAPHSLFEVTDCNIVVAYDPAVITQILANLLNQPGGITVHHPDGSTWTDYGWLETFIPSTNVEGEQPEASIKIVFGGEDLTNNVEHTEVALVSVGGT